MALRKEELMSLMRSEVRVLLHLISKVEPVMLDYRPTPTQRSLMELLRYLAIVAPVHARGAMAEGWSREVWGKEWVAAEAEANALDLDGVKAAIGRHRAMFEEVIGGASDDRLGEPLAMFGSTMSRGAWLASLVLCHYAAYRMQLFLYLKSCGREELNTLNLWAGVDHMGAAGGR